MNFHNEENFNTLPENKVFVFGSNEAGIHGAGAAKVAVEKFGAKYGIGAGFHGQSYAIPTKDKHIQTLPLDKIEPYVAMFLVYAALNPEYTFYVTKIGCGLAGYQVPQIASLFAGKDVPFNVILPLDFKPHL